MSNPVAELIISSDNTFTPWAGIKNKGSLSLSGIIDSTLTFQRSFDSGVTIKDVESFTGDVEKIIDGSTSRLFYRVGIKTGDYGTDTITCRISQ